jgi:hypothetical protein
VHDAPEAGNHNNQSKQRQALSNYIFHRQDLLRERGSPLATILGATSN